MLGEKQRAEPMFYHGSENGVGQRMGSGLES